MSDVSDGATFLDPDASRDYLRSWRADAESKAERATAMAAQMDQLRTSAEDSNNLATVTVDANGVMTDLVLTERIRHFEPQVVARAVLSALREARTRTAEQAQQIAADALGADSLSARVIGERMQHLLERPDAPGEATGSGNGWGR